MTCAMSLKTKSSSEVLAHFKEYKEHVELETGKKIKILWTDNEGEYKKFIKDYLKKCDIKHETTASYSSEQNDVSKYANRTIIEWTKAILHDTKLLKQLWIEITTIIIYLKNRSLTTNLDKQILYETWYGNKSDLSHLRILESTIYVHISKNIHTKLETTHEDIDWSSMIRQINGKCGMKKERMLLYLETLYSMNNLILRRVRKLWSRKRWSMMRILYHKTMKDNKDWCSRKSLYNLLQ